MIRIVRGEPTAEELAALVTVLLSRRPAPPGPAATGPSPWTRSGRPMCPPFGRGPQAWRASSLPADRHR